MFLTYVIKVDKTEVLMLYFKHICVVSLFLDFSGKLPLCCKRELFWVDISIFFTPLDQANLKCFGHMSSKLIKREVCRLYFKHIHVLLLFLAFPGKLPLHGESE